MHQSLDFRLRQTWVQNRALPPAVCDSGQQTPLCSSLNFLLKNGNHNNPYFTGFGADTPHQVLPHQNLQEHLQNAKGSITYTLGSRKEKKSKWKTLTFYQLLIRGISQQELVNRLTFSKADIWGMISSGVVHCQEAFFKGTLRVSVWQPHTCNPIPNRCRQRRGLQHLLGSGTQPSPESRHPNPPSVLRDADGRLTGRYCSPDDPKWREIEGGKHGLTLASKRIKKGFKRVKRNEG